MAKIRASLTSIINSEEVTSIYYRIAEYLLSNNYLVKRVSIQDVADNCYCSKSTISRFCRKLGYDDFYELNLDLYSSTKKSQDKYNPYIVGNYEQNVNKYFEDVLSCIRYAKAYIKQEDVSNLVKDLKKYKYVGVFGNLQSHSVGEIFQNDLGLSRKIVTASSLPYNQKKFIQQANKDTLIIIISCLGKYFRNQIDLSIYPKTNRPKFVLLTSNLDADKNGVYDKVIYLPSEHNYASQPRIIDIFLNIVAIEYAQIIFKEVK